MGDLLIPIKVPLGTTLPIPIPIPKSIPNTLPEDPPKYEPGHFVELSDQVLNDARHVGAGRMPLLKYNRIWLSPPELNQVLSTHKASGLVNSDQRGMVFQKVEAKLATMEQGGKDTTHVSAFNWLIGWAMTETISTLNESTKLEANRGRLTE